MEDLKIFEVANKENEILHETVQRNSIASI